MGGYLGLFCGAVGIMEEQSYAGILCWQMQEIELNEIGIDGVNPFELPLVEYECPSSSAALQAAWEDLVIDVTTKENQVNILAQEQKRVIFIDYGFRYLHGFFGMAMEAKGYMFGQNTPATGVRSRPQLEQWIYHECSLCRYPRTFSPHV